MPKQKMFQTLLKQSKKHCRNSFFVTFAMQKAFLAQSVEQLIRNEQVAGSSPVKGSSLIITSFPFYILL